MSYAVVTEKGADEDLATLPPAVQAGVIEQLLVLAASPSAADTRPARPPYPEGQLFRTKFRASGVSCLLDAVFLYSQDETRLHIQRIYVDYE